MMSDITTISIKHETKSILSEINRNNESYDQTVNRLINRYLHDTELAKWQKKSIERKQSIDANE